MKIQFRIHYNTEWGESLALILNDRLHPMRWTGNGVWTVSVNASAQELKDYGYAVVRNSVIVRTEWTHHSAEKAPLIDDSWIDCPVPHCRFTRAHSASEFDDPAFRGAGTVVPVFSLRSADDFGIGDFRDLHPLVDWAAETGQSIIQLLPVNDTTRQGGWEDSYPYNPVSSFALNPMYIRLQDLGIKETAAFKREQAALNALPETDYPRVFKTKTALLRKAFLDRGADDLSSREFRNFYRKNADWLGEYAEFCALRDDNESEYHAWVQFHLDRQLSEEVTYARSKGIHFKGDLPIGISRDSADSYWHPELFNLDVNAGAPPDFFSEHGQNWGFPTYNWEEMEKDGYAWWKRRLRKMAEYFDAYRIDHILGFFRIWEIPASEKSGKAGYFNPALSYSGEEISAAGLPLKGLFHEDPRRPGRFQPMISPDKSGLEQWQKERFDSLYTDFFYHRNNAFWKRNAERKLPHLLGATGMLACGEDLGMIPACVPEVMEHEGILSLEMPMMDKGRPWPERSVCAVSCHDMATLRMQQDQDPKPQECRRILSGVLNSASMLAIFPIQDWLSLSGTLRNPDRNAERINEPADPHHHWRYRLHIDVSALLGEESEDFRTEIRTLLRDSGRFRG